MWRDDGHANGCHVCHLPDAAIGVEFQTTQREFDRRTTRRGVFDQDERLRIVHTTTAQYGCWRIGIPPEHEVCEILSGRDGAQPPLLKSLARVDLDLLEFCLVARQIR